MDFPKYRLLQDFYDGELFPKGSVLMTSNGEYYANEAHRHSVVWFGIVENNPAIFEKVELEKKIEKVCSDDMFLANSDAERIRLLYDKQDEIINYINKLS